MAAITVDEDLIEEYFNAPHVTVMDAIGSPDKRAKLCRFNILQLKYLRR